MQRALLYQPALLEYPVEYLGVLESLHLLPSFSPYPAQGVNSAFKNCQKKFMHPKSYRCGLGVISEVRALTGDGGKINSNQNKFQLRGGIKDYAPRVAHVRT